MPIDTKGGSIKVTAGFKSSFFVYFNLRRGMRDFYIIQLPAHTRASAAACRCTFCSLSPLMCRVRKENMREYVCVFVCELNWNHSPWVCLPAAAEEMKLLCFKWLAIEIWWECVYVYMRVRGCQIIFEMGNAGAGWAERQLGRDAECHSEIVCVLEMRGICDQVRWIFYWSERIFIAPIVAWLIDDWPTNL